MTPGTSEDQKRDRVQSGDMFQIRISRSQQFSTEFVQEWYGEATEYRDEMISRLPPQDPMSSFQQSQLIWGVLPFGRPSIITPTMGDATADYLEKLARSLPK